MLYFILSLLLIGIFLRYKKLKFNAFKLSKIHYVFCCLFLFFICECLFCHKVFANYNMSNGGMFYIDGNHEASFRESCYIPDDEISGRFTRLSYIKKLLLEKCKGIGKRAFKGFDVRMITGTCAGIEFIDDEAFYGCTTLTENYLSYASPVVCTKIGARAFAGCTKLTYLNFPSALTTLGEQAFMNCFMLSSTINIPSGVKTIEMETFKNCSSITRVDLSNNITQIKSRAFYNCSKLTTINMPTKLEEIGDYAFGYCSGITSLSFPSTLKKIGNKAFNGCSGITGELIIPDGVTEIGEYAFNGCTGITKVTIPNSVVKIDNFAFNNCTALKTIEFNRISPI